MSMSTPIIIQIVAKQLHGNKQENNVAKFINYETSSISVKQKTIVPLFSSVQVSVDSIQSNKCQFCSSSIMK